ncbi:indolepyruvate oxidoreductase subunit beta [Eubacterium maltosivorans]|uniref:Indolepyruvate oxidoreductase subunit beta n=1 Tax=Eubacterium maltosivorans TaxID=2041044 RepID=A0A4P9C4P7_EUBML|nr:indolepyruvate oxidoreductase subunit beta [Eubacterium maltosivorans]QCT70293.1 indolepyruvate oxidoreductase subunit beta [Eubacterium maltosivorans]
MKTKNILLVGVGGQGTITAAKLLTTGLMEAGYDVKMSEIHGMSQRGGSVSSQVRYGDDVQSPVIEMGTADIIVAFEKMEALRYIDFLKEDGKIIVNDAEIWPLPVVIGKATYPEKILETLQEKADVRVMNASAMAEEMGNLKVMNVILLGAIIKSMGLQDIEWDEIIRNNVKPKFVDLNIKAMAVGMDAVN